MESGKCTEIQRLPESRRRCGGLSLLWKALGNPRPNTFLPATNCGSFWGSRLGAWSTHNPLPPQIGASEPIDRAGTLRRPPDPHIHTPRCPSSSTVAGPVPHLHTPRTPTATTQNPKSTPKMQLKSLLLFDFPSRQHLNSSSVYFQTLKAAPSRCAPLTVN